MTNTRKMFTGFIFTILSTQYCYAALPEKNFVVSTVDEFRTALAYDGKRNIQFKVPADAKKNPLGLVLTATDHKDFLIDKNDITIDGSTASVPVTLYGASLKISAQNVKVSHLRVRLGATGFTRHGKNKKEAHDVAREALLLDKAKNVTIDHCSFSWGTDETISFVSSENVTFKNSIISEPLNEPKDQYGEYVHYEEQPHGYCFLIRGSNKILIENTVFVDCLCRSPMVSPDGNLDNSVLIANSIVYNYGEHGTKYNDGNQNEKMSSYLTVNKNQYIPGKNTTGDAIQVDYPDKGAEVRLATIENYENKNPVDAVYTKKTNKGKIKHDNKYQLKYEDIELIPATELEKTLLPNVGATLPSSDLVDTRIIKQVKERTGKMIDHENQTPEYRYLKDA